MASSGNFATWNPLSGTTQAATGYEALYEHGNTSFRGNNSGGNNCMSVSSLHMTSGKWYFEVYLDGSPAGGWPGLGIIKSDSISVGQNVGNHQNQNYTSVVRPDNGDKNVFDQTSFASYGTSFSSTDIYNIAVDIDAGKIWWGKNNTYFNSGNPATGTNAGDTFTAGTNMALFVTAYNGTSKSVLNAGQDSSFAGKKSTGTQAAADGNSFGDFYYTPPSGYLALCSANLPISSNIDPAETDNDIPTKNFGILTYTGTGTSQGVTGLGFQADLIWIKQRNGSGHNVLTDSTRGVTKQLEITDTEGGAQPAETTNTDGVTAFGTDGFTAGGDAEYNGNTNTYVAWCWRASGGTTSTNTDGTVASTVQANQAAGFSIVSYTGTGTAMTIGHGLSSTPNFTIIKDRSNAANWIAYYDVLDGSLDYMFPNAYTGGAGSGLTGPNSSIWNLSAQSDYSNTSSRNYIMYAWHNVEGYQKFDTYEGNNTDNDGPFVYTGFRPRLLVIKGIDENYGWYVFDSERSKGNLVDDQTSWFPGGTEASEPTGARKVDFLSNGFKVMADAASINGANDTYLYMCWGDVPFKYNNGF